VFALGPARKASARFFSGLVKGAGFANFMGLKCALEDALGARVDLPLRSTDTRSVASREKRPVAIRGHKAHGVAMQPQGVRFGADREGVGRCLLTFQWRELQVEGDDSDFGSQANESAGKGAADGGNLAGFVGG